MERVYGNIVSVDQRKIFLGCINIENEKIVKIDPLSKEEIFSINQLKDLPFIMCGLIDSHIHPELSYLRPAEYARLSLSQGCIDRKSTRWYSSHIKKARMTSSV